MPADKPLPTAEEAAAMVRQAADIARRIQPPTVGTHIAGRLSEVAETVEGGGAIANLVYGQWVRMVRELIDWGAGEVPGD